jgi:hypothetical protein
VHQLGIRSHVQTSMRDDKHVRVPLRVADRAWTVCIHQCAFANTRWRARLRCRTAERELTPPVRHFGRLRTPHGVHCDGIPIALDCVTGGGDRARALVDS